MNKEKENLGIFRGKFSQPLRPLSEPEEKMREMKTFSRLGTVVHTVIPATCDGGQK
jgi:hypothetical protein